MHAISPKLQQVIGGSQIPSARRGMRLSGGFKSLEYQPLLDALIHERESTLCDLIDLSQFRETLRSADHPPGGKIT